MTHQPILSICIPTVNRAEILTQTLRTLLSYGSVDENVQIVICDNASSDNTEELISQLIKEYPQKNLKYKRNRVNIGVKNFYEVLLFADGIYCKLLNDYTILNNSSILRLKEKILKYKDLDHKEHYLNFTFNVRGINVNTDELEISGIDNFISTINNKITWVSNFGCYRDQIQELKQYEKFDDKLLNLMYWSLHLAKTRNKIIICPLKGAKCIPIAAAKRVMTYNFFNPHVIWYYEIIDYFVKLSNKQLRKDKERLLSDFVGNNIINHMVLKHPSAFNMDRGWQIAWRYFHNVPYFYYFIPLKLLRMIGSKAKRLLSNKKNQK